MAQPAAVLISGLIGNIISFLVFFAPMTTFRQVYLKRTASGFSSLPYVVSFFSCVLWVLYAVVKTDSHLLLSINSAGCTVEAVYIVFYLAYAPRRATVRTACYMLLGGAALGLCIGVTLRGFPPRHRVKFLGSVCLASSLAVFVAPLGVIAKVVRTRSAEFLPVGLCFCLVLSAVAWFCYGLFTNDPYVMYPNVGGFLLSCIQVALYIWYRRRPQNDDDGAPPPQNGGKPKGGAQGEIVELAAAV